MVEVRNQFNTRIYPEQVGVMRYDETWNMKYWNFVINQNARIKSILASGNDDVHLGRCNCRLTTDFTSRHTVIGEHDK